jgi:hypothetical protein
MERVCIIPKFKIMLNTLKSKILLWNKDPDMEFIPKMEYPFLILLFLDLKMLKKLEFMKTNM